MALPDSFVEEVRRTADIVRYISEHVALRKAGTSWKGLCPFHNEKTPSFTVNPDRQAYHCFGCGAGGDAFRFVMETEKLPFAEAVRALAERYGVTLPQAAEDDRAGVLYRALEDAATFYRRALEDPETGKGARAYLAERGLDRPVLEAYNVGLAPAGWEALSSRLGPTYGMAVLPEAGLVIRREKGEGITTIAAASSCRRVRVGARCRIRGRARRGRRVFNLPRRRSSQREVPVRSRSRAPGVQDEGRSRAGRGL
jgi:DNA primase